MRTLRSDSTAGDDNDDDMRSLRLMVGHGATANIRNDPKSFRWSAGSVRIANAGLGVAVQARYV